jgi:hypothetical protein
LGQAHYTPYQSALFFDATMNRFQVGVRQLFEQQLSRHVDLTKTVSSEPTATDVVTVDGEKMA